LQVPFRLDSSLLFFLFSLFFSLFFSSSSHSSSDPLTLLAPSSQTKKMKSAILAFAALASVAAAAADPLFYSTPIATTVWTAGSTQTVSWTNDCSNSNTTTLPIVLQQEQPGTTPIQVPVPGLAPIGTLDCAAAGSATVQVPANLPTGSTYSILVTYLDSTNGNTTLSYSTHFLINGVANTTTTTLAAAPSSTATSTVTGTKNGTTTATSTTTAGAKPTNGAGALKAGSTAALVIVLSAVGLML
jgi:hypothetical protein